MATQWISPTWRMPENSNQSKVDNYSLDFAGSAKIEYATPVDLGVVSTFSFWMNIDTGTTGALFGNTLLGTYEYIVYYSGSAFYFKIAGAYADFPNAATAISTGQWHHVAFVRPSENEVKCYIDSVLTDTITSWTGTPGSNPIKFDLIGSRPGGGLAYSGKIGQIAGFDSALTSDQVTALYNSGTPVNPMALSPLPIAYYPLGGGSTGSASTLTVPNDSVPSATVFDFGGVDDQIELPSNFVAAGEFTLSLWINPDNVIDNNFLGNGSSSSNWLQIKTASQLKVKVLSTVLVFNESGGNNLTASAWNHILIYRDASNDVGVYVNGQTFGSTNNNTSTLTLSTIGRATSIFFEGDISNTAFWTSDQSANIATIYNNGIPADISSLSPAIWYKLNVDTSNWDLTSTSWSITKIGSPYYNGASDGAYAQNGVLRSQDTNSYTIASGDYFQWNSPTIYTSGSDIVLSSSGGEANGQTSGVEVIYQYNIDNTSWTTWHQHTDTGTTDQAYAVPSTSPLTVSSNIKIRVQLAGGPNNNSFVDVSDINITGGTSSYSEDFSNVTKYGWFGGSETANPTTTAWIITDSSGNKNTGTSSGMTTANLVTSDLTRSIPYSSYSMVFDGLNDYVSSDSVPSQLNTVSLSIWVKRNGNQNTSAGVFGVRNAGVGSGNFGVCWDLAFNTTTNKIEFRIGDTGYNTVIQDSAMTDNAWTHVVGIADGANMFLYINGVKQTDTDTYSTPIETPTNKIFIGAQGDIPTTYDFTGNLSNAAVFNKSLSEDEILTIYNGGVPNSISSLSPINWWSLAGDSYYNGTNWICPDLGSASNNGTSSGMGGTELVGDGPGSTANGVATSMDIPVNLEGNAPNSTSNAFSINMDPTDRVEYDLEAKAFINAAGITDATQQLAIKTLVSSLQSNNLWTNMKAIYPMVGGTSTTHMYNLKDPQDTDAAFRLTFEGGWTHSTTGATPNGTNGRANSHLVPNTDISSVDAMSYGYYSRDTSGANGLYDMGAYQVGAVSLMLIRFGNKFYYSINQANYETPASTATSGLFVANRSGASAIEGYINGSVFDTGTESSTSLPSNDMGVGGIYGTGGYGTRECAFAFVYNGSLDATQNSNLYNAVQAFNTTLGRQV